MSRGRSASFRNREALLAGELPKLNSNDRTSWARFMLAQWLRSPEEIAKLRHQGREIILKELERNPRGVFGDQRERKCNLTRQCPIIRGTCRRAALRPGAWSKYQLCRARTA
jgi:hypothetical protein